MAAEKNSQISLNDRQVKRIKLSELLLDRDNPRFGLQNKEGNQQRILDHIVEKFGVDDILSSLAVNGYFEAEPLVCRKQLPGQSENMVVVEGNRRLAACLIITGDGRASNQKTRTDKFRKIWEDHDRPAIDTVPAIVFEAEEQEKSIQSFLGVRHIASAQPWDSYAKAAWVAQAVDRNGLSVQEVSQMIGDQHKTVNRLLEGYYLVQQLINSGDFNTQDSIRRGRGSVTDYPFSWVYTILGYVTVRDYLKLEETGARKNPIAEDNLKRAAVLLHSMFGDKSRGRNAAIQESRQIGMLASVFADRGKIRLLEQGKTVGEIETLTQPVERRLAAGLGQIRDTLRDLIARLSEQEISQDVAAELLPMSGGNRKMSVDLDQRIKKVASGDPDDEP